MAKQHVSHLQLRLVRRNMSIVGGRAGREQRRLLCYHVTYVTSHRTATRLSSPCPEPTPMPPPYPALQAEEKKGNEEQPAYVQQSI